MESDPRETLNEVLKNLHGSLKWYWQVVMGLAMVKAIDELYLRIWDHEGFTAFLFFSAFLLIFIRFYFGDSRYLDEHYIEHRKWQSLKEYLPDVCDKISKTRIILDIVLLMIIGICFVFMAKSLAYPDRFFRTYCAVLLFNVCWLSLTIFISSKPKLTPKKWKKLYKYPIFWVVNNLVHLFLIIPIFVFYKASLNKEIVLLVLCISNSCLDLGFTSNYYFPKLDKEHDERLRNGGYLEDLKD